jgi:hypothetical protein
VTTREETDDEIITRWRARWGAVLAAPDVKLDVAVAARDELRDQLVVPRRSP